MPVGNSRVTALVTASVSAKLDIIAKLEGKKRHELIADALTVFVKKEIEEKELDMVALYGFLDGKLAYKELVEIIGQERAGVARYTKNIRGKSKDFLGALD